MSKQIGVVAHCSKCGVKHQRPVGVRCRRNLNLSAPVIADLQHEDVPDYPSTGPVQQSNDTAAEAATADASGASNTSKVSQVESKLDLILQKVQDLESKNVQLEQKIQEQHSSTDKLHRFTHSSPKRSSSSANRGPPKHMHRRRHAKQVRVEESSDEEFSDLTSPRGSSTHISHYSDSFASQPSLQLLKEDERTQRKVQQQLERLQGQHRGAATSGKTIKSGLLRSGDNAVKQKYHGPITTVFPMQEENYQNIRNSRPFNL